MVHSRKGAAGRQISDCPICSARRQKGTSEVYLISEGEDRYFFNVAKAKTMAADGRPAIAIAESTLRSMASVNDYSRLHLAHVGPDTPGIMVRRFGGLVLLDGIHRAVRCLEEDRVFSARMLNYQESLACLVRQEIASTDAGSIVTKLRKVMGTASTVEPIEAEVECTPAVLDKVQAMLTPEERPRFILKAVPPPEKRQVRR